MSPQFWNRLNGRGLAALFARSVAIGVLLCSASLSFAQQQADSPDDDFYDDHPKAWQESTMQLPPAPQTADLVEIYVGPTATITAAIDLKSVTVGPDGVVRYTVVTKTSGGAVNTAYEGIRCETFEKKSYAFGRSDGSWSRSRQNKWKQIVDFGANRLDAALYKSYFCQNRIVAGKVETIVARIREKQILDLSANR